MKQTAIIRKADRHGNRDWSLLLGRMESAPFDHEGRSFVEKAGANPAFWKSLAPGDVLRCVRVLQQHGLHDVSVEIMEWLVSEHPDFEAGWREYLESLLLLGRRGELLKLRARAARHVPEDVLRQWTGADSRNLDHAGPDIDQGADADVSAPFADLRREERAISAYMNIFSGRRDVFARQWADREAQRQGYVPVRRPMTMEDVRDHLAGRRTYGIYLLDGDSTVRTGVIDIDLAAPFRDTAKMKKNREMIRREAEYILKRIADMASGQRVKFMAEASGGKGYHFWFPVSGPVPAAEMRSVLQGMVDQVKGDVRCFGMEVFPKQDRLGGKGLGNLVKLPLGIHRVTGKQSWLLGAGGRALSAQLDFVAGFTPAAPEVVRELAVRSSRAEVVIHPRHAAWAKEYPELAALEVKCPMLGQLFASLKASRTLSTREEKVLLGTLSHLPQGRRLLHHLFSRLPEYNAPLLDYRISRVRGTPLGCRRIHSLLENTVSDMPCRFDGHGYPHPLRHLPQYDQKGEGDMPVSQRVVNLEGAIENLRTALRMVERFL